MVPLLLLIALNAQIAQSLYLAADNSRASFRNSAESFGIPWPSPLLHDGGVATPALNTDLSSLLRSNTSATIEVLNGFMSGFQWEKDFQGSPLSALCRRWWWASFVASSLYLLGLWLSPWMMKDRTAFDLKSALAGWNLFLAVFSFFGAVRTAPHLVMLLYYYGFDYTVCRAALVSYGNGAPGIWVALFIFSKYFELIDTVFLVLRKRKVGFLHWYHHCSVLLYCWHAYVWEMPTGIYFVSMNYTVHAIMYFYYFLAAVCKRPPKWALLVTILQLVQMAIGIMITLSHIHIMIYGTVKNCDGHIPNLTAALGMYASYFILFAQFLVQRYCGKRDEPKKYAKIE